MMSNLATVLPKFLRDLSAAVKATGFYPPDHPTVTTAVERSAESLKETLDQVETLRIGVGDGLFLHGNERIGAEDRVISAFATYLSRRGAGALTFEPPVEPLALKSLLEVIAQEPATLRARGGPARCLAERKAAGVLLEELDSADILRAARTIAAPSRGQRQDASQATSLNDLIARFLTGQDPSAPPGARVRILRAAEDPQAAGELLKSVERLAGISGSSPGRAIAAALGKLAEEVATGNPERLGRLASNLRAALDGVGPSVCLEILQASIPIAGTDRDLAREIRADIPDDGLREMIVSFVQSEGRLTPRLASVIRKVLIDADDPQRTREAILDAVRAARQRGADPLADVRASIENLLEDSQDDWLSQEYKSLLEMVGAAGPSLDEELRREINSLPEFAAALQDDGSREAVWLTFSELLQIETEPSVLRDILTEIETRAQGVEPGWYGPLGEAASTVRAGLAVWKAPEAREAASQTLRRMAEQLIHSYRSSFHRLTEAQRADLAEAMVALGAFVVDPLLLALEQEEDWEIRKTLIRFLVARGREALPRLTKCLTSPSWFLVRNVLVVLGEIGEASLLPVIAGTLKHPEPRVRREALTALGKMGGPRAFGIVSEALGDPEVAEVAVRSLGSINRSRAIALFLEQARSVHTIGRRNRAVAGAIAALGELRADEAIPRLRSILTRSFWIPPSSGDAVRIAAARALRKIGAAEALRALERGAQERRRPVREACAAVLERREPHA